MKINFYTRSGCSLCDDAQRVLERVAAGREFSIIDVDASHELQLAYGEFVPVIEVDGERVAQWHVDEARLREALSGQKKSARRLFKRRRARD